MGCQVYSRTNSAFHWIHSVPPNMTPCWCNSSGHSIITFITGWYQLEHDGSGDSQILIGNMQHYSTVCRHGNGDSWRWNWIGYF
jgi:hypothetical protein